MTDWIRKNYISAIAIILSLIAVFRVDSFVFSESSLSWLLGIAVTLVSVGMVVILGYQIYNASTLEDRYKKAFDERIKQAEEKLSISGARSSAAVLCQAEGINLKLAMGTNDYVSVSKTLSQMAEYAFFLNEIDKISDIARIIANSKQIIDSRGIKSSSLDNFFLELSRNVLTRLPASDVNAPRLLEIIRQMEVSAGSDDKDTSQKEKQKQE